ncbi:LacI family DNA-binding transcriptional regulator [Corynebacterium choanae]|uniref:HTH-type transcriptional regulator DegA n=1 Tax=Corynebacterium choanae TaxID=1862358 RepID=A0A3G6J559_9CORY|nr:LacI family DNA-binding transcriptional regulator [Corynebacterium choanae]AZA13225.1 HTH-type transcriptional regulator DegA [Corynebacterium choanae]
MTPAATPSSKRPGIAQVAKLAGVAVGTVSNVLNHPDRVSPRTRTKVEQIIKELGYVPNASARALNKGRSTLIGAIFFDISNPFFADSSHAIDQVARSRGATMIYTGTEQLPEVERAALKRFVDLGVDAIVVCSTGGNDDALEQLVDLGIPVLAFAQRSESAKIPAVCIDDQRGMELIAAHLLGLGHESFCFISEHRQAIQHRDRLAGFHRALAAQGSADGCLQLNIASGPTWMEGYREVQQFIATNQQLPDCFVCLNDYTAFGASKALTEAGLVPGIDVAVTGYDDLTFTELLATPLTTIHQPITAMADYAANALLDVVEGRATDLVGKVFAPELIVRQSTVPILHDNE